MFDCIFTLIVIAIIVYSVLYRKCPPDSALVIFEKTPKKVSKIITEGGVFVNPLSQDYRVLSLKRIPVKVNSNNLLTKSDFRIDIELTCVIAITKNRVLLQNAAERLSGLTPIDISKWVKENISGQLRLVCATYTVDEILDGSNFINSLEANISSELKKIGIEIINLYISSVKDTSGNTKSKKQQKQTKKAEKKQEKKTQNPVKQSFAQEFEEIAKTEIQKNKAELTEQEEIKEYDPFEIFTQTNNDIISEAPIITDNSFETIKEEQSVYEQKTEQEFTQEPEIISEQEIEQYEEQPQAAVEETPTDDIFASVRHYFENKNQ